MTAIGNRVAANPNQRARCAGRSLHHTNSYIKMRWRIATALSFEKTPIVVTIASPASQTTRTDPVAPALFKYIRKPESTPIAPNRSARPTMLGADSVKAGGTDPTKAMNTEGHNLPNKRQGNAY